MSPSWKISPATLPEMKVHTIHLWRANLDEFNTSSNCLSKDEKARATRFKFPIHQQRFTAARSILRQILACYLNQTPKSLVFEYTKNGKPFISNNQSIHFNISHSNQWAVYAIGLEEKIGVDVEHLRADIDIKSISQRFFSTYENQILAKIPGDEKQLAFFKLWTCKEAFIKAIGEGLSFPLKDFDVDICGENLKLNAIRDDKQETENWSLTQLNVAENYIGALAIKCHIETIELWDWSK